MIPGSPLQLSAVELIIIAVTPDIPLSSPPRQTFPAAQCPSRDGKEGRKDMGREGEEGRARRGWSTKRTAYSFSRSFILLLILLSVHRLRAPLAPSSEHRSLLSLCLIECGCSTCTPHTCSAHHPQGSPRPDANGEFSFLSEATEEHKRSIDPHFGEPCGTHQGARAPASPPSLPAYKRHLAVF